jgi:DNA-binding FadR family transcriptional regulator
MSRITLASYSMKPLKTAAPPKTATAKPAKTRTAGEAGSRSDLVRTQRIPQLMANDVRRRILRGELAVGQAIPPEAELMAQYGISRPTLREALRILESEQLIIIRRGGIGGAIVQRPDLDVAARQFGSVLQDRGATMADVHRARTIIEPPALAALATSVTPAQLAELETKLEETNALIGNPTAYSEAVEIIRERIVEMTGAVTVALIMRLLREVVQKHTAAVGGLPADRWAKLQTLSQRSHLRLLRLIGEGDAAAAQEFWQQHLAEVQRHLGRVANMRVIDLTE